MNKLIDALSKVTDSAEGVTQREDYPEIPGKVKSKPVLDTKPRGEFIFPAESSTVNDNRGHFPINTEDRARNALARVAQYKSLPKWYSGDMTLSEFQEHVRGEVSKAYPSIKVSDSEEIPSFPGKDKLQEWAKNQSKAELEGRIVEVGGQKYKLTVVPSKGKRPAKSASELKSVFPKGVTDSYLWGKCVDALTGFGEKRVSPDSVLWVYNNRLKVRDSEGDVSPKYTHPELARAFASIFSLRGDEVSEIKQVSKDVFETEKEGRYRILPEDKAKEVFKEEFSEEWPSDAGYVAVPQ